MGGHVHVAGVAGVGMSALAQALRWTHGRVTGSDRFFDQGQELPIFGALRAAGIELTKQDGSAVDAHTEAVVYSTAIEADNPEFLAAKKAGVPLRHRAEMLAELARGKTVLAVAGTAGKTTTTGMLGWTLEQLGADPTVVNGGALVDWADARHVGNVRRGGASAPWVLEVDESDRSLLNFRPEWSILTNVSQDHFALAEVQELFRAYASQVRTGIVCGAGVAAVLGKQKAQLIELSGTPERTAAGFAVAWRGLKLVVPQPGAHNALNALAAAELCAQLGYAPERIAAALARFGGIQRRLERVDAGGGVRVVDDYGHNPAKLAAAWTAVAAPGNRVLGVWRPHGYGPLRAMLDPLADAFASVCRPQDKLWLLPVYDAGGTTDRSIQSDALAAKLRVRGVAAELAANYDDLGAALAGAARAGDVILTMGARDPRLPAFAREMAAKTADR
ncbi:MAG TPA: Mur ligase domain-containing protein [Kiritimatiellia bacterium]|nr:Mur ligase domain-containing protein [Kiritimatiellia bacterium]